MSEPAIDKMLGFLERGGCVSSARRIFGYLYRGHSRRDEERSRMTEPTIDEMLDWLDQWEGDNGRVAAIRAILEQHRDSIEKELVQCSRCLKIMPDVCVFYCGDCDPDTTVELEAIRAFVERVRWRVDETWRNAALVDQAMYTHAYVMAVEDELAAMEKEAEQ